MDALSIANLGLGLADLYGNYKAGQAAASGLEASAEVSEVQAQVVLANAEYAVRRAEENGRRDMGTYTARFAKAGVRFEGTPAISLADTERSIRLDVLATRLNAANKANEYGFAAMNARVGASIQRMASANAVSQGLLKLGGKFLMSQAGEEASNTNMKSNLSAYNKTYGITSSARGDTMSRNIPFDTLTVSRRI